MNGRSVALAILTGIVLCPCVSSKSFHETERNTNDAFQVRDQGSVSRDGTRHKIHCVGFTDLQVMNISLPLRRSEDLT